MDLTLYQPYAPEEAATAFAGGADPEWFCDRQFTVLPHDILCFITIGDPATASHVSTPEIVCWRPARLDYHPEEPADEEGYQKEYHTGWLPLKVREDRSAEDRRIRIRWHQLFLRRPGEDRYLYVGPASLGSYGGGGGCPMEAKFFLKENLSREAWLRFGGFAGWLVYAHHKSHEVQKGDEKTFSGIVEKLAKRKRTHLILTRYEDDKLEVHLNRERGWLMYLSEPGDPGLYTRDPGETSEEEELFSCTCGIDLEFPRTQTLPRDLALQAATEFFTTGALPTCVPWEEE